MFTQEDYEDALAALNSNERWQEWIAVLKDRESNEWGPYYEYMFDVVWGLPEHRHFQHVAHMLRLSKGRLPERQGASFEN